MPNKLALLSPAVEGQVAEILVEQGQHVTAGQAILQLDSTLAQSDLAEKQAASDSLKASLRLLESLPRSEEQQASRLAIEQAEIVVARTEALVQRLRPLKERAEVPEQQMFEAEQGLKQAQVQLQTAQAQFDVLMLKPRPEAIAEAQSRVNVADEAVKTSQTRLNLHAIRAPIDGVLDRLSCRPGEMIAVGAKLGEIIDDREVRAIAWLPLSRAQLVRIGQAAHVRGGTSGGIDAAASQRQPALDGRVKFVGRSVDGQTANLPVHVLVDNSQGQLLIGQTLEVTVDVQEPTANLCVPLAAIHDEGEGPGVTVVRDGKAVLLHPQFGVSDAGWTAVTSTDIKAGEPVVVEGAYNLPDGTPVSVDKATSNRAESAAG